MAYNLLILKKIFDYIKEKKFENIKTALDFGDQDLNMSFEDLIENFKKNKVIYKEKKFEALKEFPKRPRVPSSTLWLTLGFIEADRVDITKISRRQENIADGTVYEMDLNYKLNKENMSKKYQLVTDFGNNEHVFNLGEACEKNGLIWTIQNLYGANGYYNFDLSYFEAMAASNQYLIEDSFMIIKKFNTMKLMPIDDNVFKNNDLNNLDEIQVSYLFRKQNDDSFKFPYQGLGDTPIRDKFYKLINNTEVKYDLKRFYIPRKVDQINTKVLLNEIIKRIKKKFLK